MWLVEVPPAAPRSVLPAGGSPSGDADYLAWRDGFLCRLADRLTVASWYASADLDPSVLAARRLDAHLFAALGGSLPPFDGVTYSHRLRFLAVGYGDRRRAFFAAARTFSAGVTGG